MFLYQTCNHDYGLYIRPNLYTKTYKWIWAQQNSCKQKVVVRGVLASGVDYITIKWTQLDNRDL